MTRLEALNLAVELGGQEILHDISLEMNSGEIVGLIGPNGAGKSTLIRTMSHLVPPSAGQLRLDGKSLGAYGRKALARQISYLPQGHTVHWALETEQLVTLGRLPHLSPFAEIGNEDRAVVEHAMDRTHVSKFRKRTTETLSGGERARVMLARALATEAPVMLADEPAASLDPYHQLQVMELLRMLAREGKLVVCVLHDLPLAARFCDRLVLMAEGRIVAQGAPSVVLNRDNLQTAYLVEGVYGTQDGEDYVLPWRRLGLAQGYQR